MRALDATRRTTSRTSWAAQYRVSRLREADVRLTWADPLSTALVGDPTPAELALLALSQHRFGRTDPAR